MQGATEIGPLEAILDPQISRDNPYCIHRALDFEQWGLRERLELVQMPPGMPFDNGRYELTEEPLPPGDEPATISGVDLESVRTATFATQGLSSPDRIHAALQRSRDRD
jgi:hypothetical protein